jgi:uncharacterized protein (DUF1778 family)
MKKKIGRPPINPEDHRSEIVPVRLTKAERTDFDAAAKSREMSLSDWMREHLRRAASRDLGRK